MSCTCYRRTSSFCSVASKHCLSSERSIAAFKYVDSTCSTRSVHTIKGVHVIKGVYIKVHAMGYRETSFLFIVLLISIALFLNFLVEGNNSWFLRRYSPGLN